MHNCLVLLIIKDTLTNEHASESRVSLQSVTPPSIMQYRIAQLELKATLLEADAASTRAKALEYMAQAAALRVQLAMGTVQKIHVIGVRPGNGALEGVAT
jgi:hypothetical protein